MPCAEFLSPALLQKKRVDLAELARKCGLCATPRLEKWSPRLFVQCTYSLEERWEGIGSVRVDTGVQRNSSYSNAQV